LSQIKKLAGQTAIYGLSSIVGRFLNYLMVPIYTRVFDRAEYGVVSELYAYVSFLMILYTYGMETAFFNFSQKEEDKNKVYSSGMFSIIISSVLISAIFILFSHPIASLIKYPQHAEYITWFALVLAFDAMTALPFARLRQLNKASTFALIKIANIFLNIGFNVFFLIICPKYANEHSGFLAQISHSVYSAKVGVGYVFISNLLASFITLLLLLPGMCNIKLKPDYPLLKRMLIYSAPLLIAGFAGMINETLDRAIYKYIAPNPATALSELGVYSACYKLSIIMTLFIQTFRYAAEPFFFSQHKNENRKGVYALVMKYFVITCAFIFVGVMLYLNIIKYFIGEEFRAGLAVVPILLLANMCLGIFYNLSMWYKLTGQTRFGAYFAIFGGALTVVLLFVMIPRWGYMGAAWATLITYAAMMVVSFVSGQKNYPIPYKLSESFIFISLALLIYFASMGIDKLLSPSASVAFILHTLLLLIFAAFVYVIEKPKTSVVSRQS
jgi:O-antigen/teichoic acid export membrane protein